MTFSETFAEYWPSMLIGLKRNRDYDVDFDGYLFACWLAFRLRTILANPKVKGHQPWLYWVLNFIVTVIRSFPYLLFVIALIPVTRSVLGKAFGPIPSSVPLSIVAIAIFARLVEQVLLDVPEEIYF